MRHILKMNNALFYKILHKIVLKDKGFKEQDIFEILVFDLVG